jgi:hypothetical protein
MVAIIGWCAVVTTIIFVRHQGLAKRIRVTLQFLLVAFCTAWVWHVERDGVRRLPNWVTPVLVALLVINAEVIRYVGNRQRPRTNDLRPT